MTRIVKPLDIEITVTGEDDINNARLVRIFASSLSVITVTDPTANTVVGSFTMPANSVEYLEKEKEHVISSTAAVKCAPVSYKS
jgi:hypothetical protein